MDSKIVKVTKLNAGLDFVNGLSQTGKHFIELAAIILLS
jgi:hypothetical protein